MSAENPLVTDAMGNPLLAAMYSGKEPELRKAIRGEWLTLGQPAEVLEIVSVQCAVKEICERQQRIISEFQMPEAEGGLEPLAPRYKRETYMHNFDWAVAELGQPTDKAVDTGNEQDARHHRIGLLTHFKGTVIIAQMEKDAALSLGQLPKVDTMILAATIMRDRHEDVLAQMPWPFKPGRQATIASIFGQFENDLSLLRAVTLAAG